MQQIYITSITVYIIIKSIIESLVLLASAFVYFYNARISNVVCTSVSI